MVEICGKSINTRVNCTLQEVGDDAMRRLRLTCNLQDLCSADIIVEAIVESEDIKKKLFKDLDGIAKSSAILASNTSSISITRLASATQRPTQVSRLFFTSSAQIDHRAVREFEV